MLSSLENVTFYDFDSQKYTLISVFHQKIDFQRFFDIFFFYPKSGKKRKSATLEFWIFKKKYPFISVFHQKHDFQRFFDNFFFLTQILGKKEIVQPWIFGFKKNTVFMGAPGAPGAQWAP